MFTYLYISSFINVFFLIQKHLHVEAYHIKRGSPWCVCYLHPHK